MSISEDTVDEQKRRKAEAALARFWELVDMRGPDHCWHWMGRMTREGYGTFSLLGRSLGAHLISFCLENERRPNEVVRHTCDNRSCVNPAHLISGTQTDNMRDMVERGRSAGQLKTRQNFEKWLPPPIVITPHAPTRRRQKPRRRAGGRSAHETFRARQEQWRARAVEQRLPADRCRADVARARTLLTSCPWADPLEGLYKPERAALTAIARAADKRGWVWSGWQGGAGFVEFLAAVGPRPSSRHRLARINAQDGYRPGNVEWRLL